MHATYTPSELRAMTRGQLAVVILINSADFAFTPQVRHAVLVAEILRQQASRQAQ